MVEGKNPGTPEAGDGAADDGATERKRLADIVKDSSDKNRNYFIAWVLFCLFVLLSVGGTTDRQLLVPDSGVDLPFVGVKLPLLSFFLVAPIIVLAGQFNLLQNLDSHAFKLERWREAWRPDGPPREELQAFLFDFAMLERNGAFGSLVFMASDFLFYWLGPFVVVVILVRFSDYQSPQFTTIHFFCLLISLWISIEARKRLPHAFRAHHKPSRVERGALLVVAASCGMLAVLPVVLVWSLYFRWQVADSVMSFLDGLQEEPQIIVELTLPRIYIPPSVTLPAATADPTKLGAGQPQRYSVDLSHRRLDFARMPSANLGTSDLSLVSMRHARMPNASFRSANLWKANLDGGEFGKAQFQNASLAAASVQSTDMEGAHFDGAQLSNAHSIVDLIVDDDPPADFTNARLIGATFFGTSAVGVNFTSATLTAATFVATSLTGAQFLSASMASARFFGVSFKDPGVHADDDIVTTFDGASLSCARFVDVDFDDASFLGTLSTSAFFLNVHFKDEAAAVNQLMVRGMPFNLDDPKRCRNQPIIPTIDWTTINTEIQSGDTKSKVEAVHKRIEEIQQALKKIDSARAPSKPTAKQKPANENVKWQQALEEARRLGITQKTVPDAWMDLIKGVPLTRQLQAQRQTAMALGAKWCTQTDGTKPLAREAFNWLFYSWPDIRPPGPDASKATEPTPTFSTRLSLDTIEAMFIEPSCAPYRSMICSSAADQLNRTFRWVGGKPASTEMYLPRQCQPIFSPLPADYGMP
jgi:uncharacterized protein YjbI with pentapeptide repeats